MVSIFHCDREWVEENQIPIASSVTAKGFHFIWDKRVEYSSQIPFVALSSSTNVMRKRAWKAWRFFTVSDSYSLNIPLRTRQRQESQLKVKPLRHFQIRKSKHKRIQHTQRPWSPIPRLKQPLKHQSKNPNLRQKAEEHMLICFSEFGSKMHPPPPCPMKADGLLQCRADESIIEQPGRPSSKQWAGGRCYLASRVGVWRRMRFRTLVSYSNLTIWQRN